MADKPVHTLRDGAIGVAIWHRTERSRPRYEITMSRSYHLADSDTYGYTKTLRASDLSTLADLLSQATDWVRARDPAALDPPRRGPGEEEPGAP